jgi:hypothetical protein
MKQITLFALLAMMPAVFNISPASARGPMGNAPGNVLLAPICTGDGISRKVSVPLGPQDIPGKEVPGCCVKGCHGGERKRSGKKCC